MVLGLEECIDGAVLEYFSSQGLVCLASEGGQHGDPRTIDHLEACIWLAMDAAGMLTDADIDLEPYHDILRLASRRLPAVLEVHYRQHLSPHDGFVMKPGFKSFDQVSKGQLLAHNNKGALTASDWGRILLPLYQGQGLDGFFLCRGVNPFWLKVATVLRALNFDRIAHWLPGVERDPDSPNTLLVNPNMARWHVNRVFHLLGFREGRPLGGKFVFTRRWTAPEGRRLRG
jgi:succinylglutamate desuccinylase